MTITINGTTGIAGVDGSASTPAVQGTDTNTGLFFGTDTVTIATGGTTAVTVDSGQRTKFPTTIGVGGATPATSGSGITFPATASASSDANTLDDYEEGTWNMTVTYDGSASGVTYNSRTGYYTKVGNFVFVSGPLSLSSKGTGSGSVRISLPFTSHATRGGLAVGNTQDITVNNSPRELMVEASTDYFVIRYPTGSGLTADVQYSGIANNFYVVFGGCYQVA